MDVQKSDGGLGMRVKVLPGALQGTVSIPSSKSLTHRAIICASLAKGTSVVDHITFSKDIDATIACMRNLGAKITVKEDACTIQGTDVRQVAGEITCDCSESGSTLRFLIPIAALSDANVTFIGHGRLMQRPMTVYKEIFQAQHLRFEQDQTIRLRGPLQARSFAVQGDISSQFISGLLFALPLLEQDSTIEILPPYESASYVNLTTDSLASFGITVHHPSPLVYQIPGGQSYQAAHVSVEGDASQMAFYAVEAAIQSSLTCAHIDPHSHQGDQVILDFVKAAGADVQGTTITHQSLQAQTMDIADCPDLGPILCVLAAYCPGTSRIIHARRLRMKESDRIAAMEQELRKWGVQISSTEDEITITGKAEYHKTEPVRIDGHNDHRIVMAMTIFGLCAKSPSIIEGAEAIEKSYPDFFTDIKHLNGKVEIL
jgi:3-phosphoshikimate 1-carboxyvinyltransferase